MLIHEDFYDHEYNAWELSTSLMLARYLRSNLNIFTLKSEDFYARTWSAPNSVPQTIFLCADEKESHDLWCP
jgi:hypothetical protein